MGTKYTTTKPGKGLFIKDIYCKFEFLDPTLHIEVEVGFVQQKAAKLATKKSELLAEMQK